MPARAVAVHADRAAYGQRAAGHRARNGLRDAVGAVRVQRADDADVAGAVEALGSGAEDVMTGHPPALHMRAKFVS